MNGFYDFRKILVISGFGPNQKGEYTSRGRGPEKERKVWKNPQNQDKPILEDMCVNF